MHKLLPFFLVTAAGLIWITLKSISQPLIFDEATTIITFLPDGCGFPWVTSAIHSNNHLGLTYLLKLFASPRNNVWVFRLVSILAFIPYCWGIWRYFDEKSTKFKILLLIGLLNPFLLEFFSLARGYAPFLACFIWFLIHIKKFSEIHSLKNAYATLSLGFISSLFYLGSIIPVGIGMFFVILQIQSNLQKVTFGIIAGALFAPLLHWGNLLRDADQLYFGTTDPVHVFNSLSSHFANKTSTLFTILTIVCFAVLVISIARKRVSILQNLLLFYIISIISQFIILDTPLPQQRTAIPLLLVFILSSIKSSRFNGLILVTLGLISVINLPYMSLYEAHIEDWRLQQMPKEYSRIINNYKGESSVGGYRYANLSHMYNTYNLTRKAYLFEIKNPNSSNFIIIPRSQKLDTNLYQIHKQIEHSSLTLWKKIKEHTGPKATIASQDINIKASPHILLNCDTLKYVRGIQSIVGLDSLIISLSEDWQDCEHNIHSNYPLVWNSN